MSETQNIPIVEWGKDHWSTLAYIETRIVDYGGRPDKLHLRVDSKRHPAFGHSHRPPQDKDYPTRIRGGREISPHDDIDCIEDMVAAVVLKWEGTGFNPVFILTDFGMMLCNAIRNHKASGGSFGNFEYQAPAFTESLP